MSRSIFGWTVCSFLIWTSFNVCDSLVYKSALHEYFAHDTTPVDCKSLPDGPYGYGSPCNPLYILCKKNETFHEFCEPPFFFNRITRNCTGEELSPACLQVLEQQKNEPQENPELYRQQYLKQEAEQDRKSPYDWSRRCDDLKNEKVQWDQCGTTYVECTNGKGKRDTCPAGLFFGQEEQRCDTRLNLKGCRNWIKSLPPCMYLNIGWYGHDGDKFVYRCLIGVPIKVYCPVGSRWSTVKDKCKKCDVTDLDCQIPEKKESRFDLS